MVYETRYNLRLSVDFYFKVHIEVNDKGEVNTKKSSRLMKSLRSLKIRKETGFSKQLFSS